MRANAGSKRDEFGLSFLFFDRELHELTRMKT
jgi:hypothetical protein